MRPGLYQQGVALTVESTFGLDAATDLGASPAPGFDVDADIARAVDAGGEVHGVAPRHDNENREGDIEPQRQFG